jgi:hypothetical protein
MKEDSSISIGNHLVWEKDSGTIEPLGKILIYCKKIRWGI